MSRKQPARERGKKREEPEVTAAGKKAAETKFREVLNRHRDAILKGLVMSPTVLNVMKRERLFSTTMFTILQRDSNPIKQTEKVVDMILKTGYPSFLKFIHVLKLTMHGRLAELLEHDLQEDIQRERMQTNVEIFLNTTERITNGFQKSGETVADRTYDSEGFLLNIPDIPPDLRSPYDVRSFSYEVPKSRASAIPRYTWKGKSSPRAFNPVDDSKEEAAAALSSEFFVIPSSNRPAPKGASLPRRSLTVREDRFSSKNALTGIRRYYEAERTSSDKTLGLLRQEEVTIRELFEKNKKEQDECEKSLNTLDEIKMRLDQVSTRNERLKRTDANKAKINLHTLNKLL